MYETKEAVLQAKVLNRIQMNTPRMEDIVASIQQDGALLNDFLVPNQAIRFSANGKVYGEFNGQQNKFTDFSLWQMAEKLGVPVKYVVNLSKTDWGRQLIAHNFTEMVDNSAPQTYLIREIDGHIRGVMSDRYKIMDTMQIFMAFMQGALESGAKLYDGLHTDSKNFMEVVHPEILPIETKNNGMVPLVLGARVRNSDFGDGALSLKIFTLNTRCLNGMVGEQLLREVHLGGRITNIQHYLSSDTIRKETAAQAAIVGDTMRSVFGGEYRDKEIARIMQASDMIVDYNQEVKALPKLGVYESEVKALSEKLMNNDPNDGIQGKNTMWKIVQGLTAVANDQQPARTRELQEIASSLY
jgi:hypothetical protein